MKRFTIENATKIVAYLISSGLDPLATTISASKRWNGGCGDPECCPQHPGVTQGESMVSIKTIISGNKLHKIAVELGLKLMEG